MFVRRSPAPSPRPAALRRSVVALVCATFVLSCPASAKDEEELCLAAKLRATRVGASALLGCKLRAAGDSERLSRCLARADARIRALLADADLTLSERGFACPGSAESLALSGAVVWPSEVVAAHVGKADGRCAGLRIKELRRYVARYARCRSAEPAADAAGVARCAKRRRAALIERWQDAERFEDCAAAASTAEEAAAAVEDEIEESASRVEVRCGDGRRGGFEQCDDGGEAAGDGCSDDCRRETCGRVGSEVRCIVCPADSEPTADYDACVCPSGYEGEPGACTDIDECALGIASCPEGRPCSNLQGTYGCAIPCTEDAFRAALDSCGAPNGVIAFACRQTTIPIAAVHGSTWRRTECDDLVIDGANRGVAFELDPLCWGTPVDPLLCPGGLAEDGTCACPDVDDGPVFLELRGDRSVVRGLTVRGFFDGIRTRGSFNRVENVRFERQCDDAFGSTGGVANVFRDVVAVDGCDKCSQHVGVVSETDPDERLSEHYNGIFESVEFLGCATPLRMAASGRFLLRGLDMTPAAGFPCDGPRFSTDSPSASLFVRMEDSLVAGCRRGIRFGGSARGVIADTRVEGCRLRGLRAAGSSRVSSWRSAYVGNGGDNSTEPGFGGIAVLDSAQVDLGGGATEVNGAIVRSTGENTICANVGPGGAGREIENATGASVAAEANWWCGKAPPFARLVGPVDSVPFLVRAP